VKSAGGINWPVEFMLHVGAETILVGLLRTLVHGPASAGLKPLPVIVIAAPGVPELGMIVIVGVEAVTVNTAVAVSPLLPVTVTTYTPGVAVLTTVKLLTVN